MAKWAAAWSRSGGIVYHFSAWRHGRLWADHRAATAQFLGAWSTSERNLLLIGTSAGYSLPNALFSRFEQVVACEPDPLARRLFTKRFPDVTVRWLDDDFLGPRKGSMSVAGLAEMRARFAGHAVLFCNVLGQLPVVHKEADGEQFIRFLTNIPEVLEGVSWASYHDRVSGPWPPQIHALQLPRSLDTEELMNQAYAPLAGGQALEYWDHQTGALAAQAPRQIWLWQRTPSAFHLIEAVCSSC